MIKKNKKKVILVQPFYPFWHKGSHNFFYPFALLRIASMIYKDYEVVILDQNVDRNIKSKLLKHLKDNPVLVGITSATGNQIRHGLNLSKIVKQNSNVPVVWGGKHPTILPRQTLENEFIDIVVFGEGELTFKELVTALDKKRSLRNVKGIMYKKNSRIYANKRREFIDMNELPDVDFEKILDFSKYKITGINSFPVNLETSRGCPNNCTYCYNTQDRKWRAMSAEKAISKLRRYIQKYPKEKNLFIWDDNFFVDMKRAEKILDELQGFGISIQGTEVNTLKKMEESTLKKLNKRNYAVWFYVGVESGSQKIIDLLNKKFKISDVIKVNRRLKKYIRIYFNYHIMIGLPHETREDRKKSMRLILKLVNENKRALVDNLKIFTPYPGTKLFDEAVKLGFKAPEKLEDWAEFSWLTAKLPWLSKKERIEIEKLLFMSYFIDKKFEYYYAQRKVRDAILILYIKVIRQIFRLRYRYYYTNFLIEKWIYDIIVKVLGMEDRNPVDKE